MAVTDEDLRKLIVLPADLDTSGVISLASVIRTQFLADKGLATELLDSIEQLLAAHFAVLYEERGGLKRKSIGETAETYREIHPRETGLRSTRYGSQAVMLDTSNTLLTMASSKGAAQFEIITPSE